MVTDYFLKKEAIHLSRNIVWEPLFYVKVALMLESRAVANFSQILSRGALSLHGNVAGSWLQCTAYSSDTLRGSSTLN